MHLLVEEFLKDNIEFKRDILETLENDREKFIDWRCHRESRGEWRESGGNGEGTEMRRASDTAAAPLRWPRIRGRSPPRAQTARAHITANAAPRDAGPTGTSYSS